MLAFAKLRKTTISFVMSVRPHGTTGCSIRCVARAVCAATHVTIVALFCGSSLLRSSNCIGAAEYEAGQSVSANVNERCTGENCHLYILVVNASTPYS